MQKTTKLSLAAIAAAIAIIALIFSSPVVTAAGSSGKFNPQTQFPVGTTVTFN